VLALLLVGAARAIPRLQKKAPATMPAAVPT